MSKVSFEKIRKHIIRDNLSNFWEYFEMVWFEIKTKLHDLLNNWKIAICCYWSDWRLEKWNKKRWSMDLIVCTEDEIDGQEIKNAITEFAWSVQWILFEQIYYEWEENGNEYYVKEDLEIGNDLSVLSEGDLYIDVIKASDEKYRYNGRYFPDRLIDAFFLLWNNDIVKKFKLDLMKSIIEKKQILERFKEHVKTYFQEAYIRWKNQYEKKGLGNHFNLDSNFVYFDRNNYYAFKYWPIRALQYKVIEIFIKYWRKLKDERLILDFPQDINSRLDFFERNKVVNWFLDTDYEELKILYNFFRNLNTRIEIMYDWKIQISKKQDIFQKENWVFTLSDDLLKEVKEKLDRFIYLFKKI